MSDEYRLYFTITKNGLEVDSEWISIEQVKKRRWDIIGSILNIIINRCDLLED